MIDINFKARENIFDMKWIKFVKMVKNQGEKSQVPFPVNEISQTLKISMNDHKVKTVK